MKRAAAPFNTLFRYGKTGATRETNQTSAPSHHTGNVCLILFEGSLRGWLWLFLWPGKKL
jgi:hypothetical protein